ncbi:MAG: precorrin-6y C5,15-methyltransferase (decarboxylating) subunit CbiE [Pseudomonadota bacterium]
MTPWLDIIGIGEDGMAGLSAAARQSLESAEVIIGGERHHALSETVMAERLKWPHPFDALIEEITVRKGQRLVVLATGDPLWYSVGARIAHAVPPHEIRFFPQLSAFQWAAARMGWSLADVETLTAHGRPAEQLVPYFWPGARLIILTAGAETPGQVARLLAARGFGASRMTVFGALGGARESRHNAHASDWAAQDPAQDLPAFNTLAVDCIGHPEDLLTRVPGLPDDAFRHDGMLTKRAVRAVTLSRLMPARGEVLWDIGTGCGSVAIEWMRAGRDATALGIDPHAERLAMARHNAEVLGTPRLELIEGRAVEVLETLQAPDGTKPDLRRPDAIFIGGGLTPGLIAYCVEKLPKSGRLVANAVTLESEAILREAFAQRGGDLTRIAVESASPVGRLTGWRPAMTVTQWALQT